jgi:cyclic-di-GMP-binding protein
VLVFQMNPDQLREANQRWAATGAELTRAAACELKPQSATVLLSRHTVEAPLREAHATMADPSFDVVSKIDRQEVDNALNQAAKELGQRFDFRGTNTSIDWSGELGITIKSDTEERASAALDVFKEKLIKRSISLKALDAGDPKQSGKQYVIAGTLAQGIDSDNAKKIAKLIRDEGPKGVQAQIQGDQLRVSGKKRDDLQAVQALLRGADVGVALQFDNYR